MMPKFEQWWKDQESGAPSMVFDSEEAMARAAYEQGKRDAIPEGFVLVPKEPTSFMKSAMCSVTLYDKEYQFCYDLCWEEATELYKAAIANSPIAAAKKGES